MPTYISKEGLEDLKKEFEKRKTTERKKITEQIAAAKELGDLSENFEYHEAKEQQGLNESRILQLEAMILDSVIVEETRGSEAVTLGVTFKVEINGAEKTYSMVGSSEADPLKGKISNESPIGKAFMGAKVGDMIEVEVPSGTMTYKIVGIE